MTRFRALLTAGLFAAGLVALTGLPAQADPPAAPAAPAASDHLDKCFYLSDWRGWSAPSENVIYMRVHMHDIYRVELSSGTSLLQAPAVHLVSEVRGPDSVCYPIDLDLWVSDGQGFKERLMAKSISKLTAAEIAAIPKKYVP